MGFFSKGLRKTDGMIGKMGPVSGAVAGGVMGLPASLIAGAFTDRPMWQDIMYGTVGGAIGGGVFGGMIRSNRPINPLR